MRLSIITINYNNAAGLRKTLESVKVQTSSDWEHIIVDGGSTDGSVDVITEYLSCASYASHVTWWCSEKDKGIYDAMNKGIPHATGEYCLFLNSGDTFTSAHILETVFYTDFSEDLVYFNVNFIAHNKIQQRISPPPAITALFLFQGGMVNHQSIFIKTTLQKKYLYSDKYRVVSDRLFFLTAVLKENCSTRYIDETLCNYECEDGFSSRNGELGAKERDELKDVFFPQRVQEDLRLLEDYENGYKGVLKKMRSMLFAIAKVTFRKKAGDTGKKGRFWLSNSGGGVRYSLCRIGSCLFMRPFTKAA